MLIIYLMVITNLQEKENRKLYVPIRPGNRGGWSLFDWESVRQMPYRDREMYLGNSAKIGVLDKGGKWRKKDWFLKKGEFSEAEKAQQEMKQAIKRDQQRMNTALGITQEQDQEKLTEAEMKELMKKIKMKKEEDFMPVKKQNAIGLGFDKSKVQIRAVPSAKVENPHRLQGNQQQYEREAKNRRDQSSIRKYKKESNNSHQQRHHRHRHDSESSEQRRQRRKRRDQRSRRKSSQARRDRREKRQDRLKHDKRERSRSVQKTQRHHHKRDHI